jgi:peptidoglycan/LPS O-acetylase OafA/YrhL
MPGLDGLRAIAVLAVIAYHLNFGWASGGLLGVGIFFTLSGYLITDILLTQWDDKRLRLGDFWLRRARRLLPALFLMLIVVTLWVAIADHSKLSELRGEVASAALYVNNWWQISQHMSYFARFGPPSPLGHLWSLAVEEQFYLIWPWLLLAGVHLVRERRRPIRIRPRLAGVTLVLAAASAIEMAVLFHPTFDATRIYDGTDTRAFGLLFGAALAMVWPSRELTTRVGPSARSILDGLGVAGLIAIGLLIWRTNQYSPFLYHGGIVLLSIATVAVIASAAHPVSRVGRAMGWEPLRWIGVRSYAIYLWHEPIIVLTTPAFGRATDPLRATLQVAATFVIAALSWRYVEDPIRRGALKRVWAQARSAHWRPRALPQPLQVGLAASLLVLVLVGVALAGVKPPSLGGSSNGVSQSQLAAIGATPSRASTANATGQSKHASHSGRSGSQQTAAASVTSTTTSDPPTATKLRSSCQSVIHIGDSTSEGLTSSDYLPDPRQRMGAQYARVGVKHSHFAITGATSIVETLPGTTNAQDAARQYVHDGYRGCWVLALGTNDTADVYVGSNVGLSARIQQMMSAIGNQPVMWVNVKSLLSSGPYAEQNMEQWDQALLQDCSKYPNMRVYDWASAVKDKWFIPDGIHYYSPGYAARAHLIADALAEAFPQSGSSSGCVVHTKSVSIRVRGVH